MSNFMYPNTGGRIPFPSRSALSSSHKKPTLPPPYGENHASPEANNLSESVTAHHIHALAKDVFAGAVPSAIEEWINGRSREELSSLLVRANELIRERERGKSTPFNHPSPYELTVPFCPTELTMTSELSRNLYNSNISLEEKHKAFLARLPTPSALTPRTTPSSSPVPTPESRPILLPRVRNFHARRISVSPSDLALLADQNAELLQKLEKLETESAQANLAGRRRLGKLEKEIDALREELDQHRTQSDALQSQVVARVDEEARRRRQEWGDRVRAHRKSSRNDDAESDGAVRDFAPHGSGGGPSAGFKPLLLPVAPDTDTLPDHMDSGSPAKAPSPLPPPTPQRSSPAVATVPPPTGESALVAQLVSKVHELELTNSQILESQRDTATKLQEAHIEAEGIRRLYAFLDEQKDVELEVVEDGESEDQPVQDPSATMRFRSLRRSIHGDLRQLSTPAFEKGTESDVEATVSSTGTDLIKGPPLRARKTVVGLFDTPSQPARDGAEPAMMMISNPSSPALSTLDLPAGSLFTRQVSHGPTLGSELGSDYGDDYVENHHLRSSSLYDVFLSGPSATSRPTTPASPRPDTQPLSQDEPQPSPSKPSQDLDKTPQKPSPRVNHRHRLSDTIRARTHYWVDRRFHHTAPFVGRLANLFETEGGNGSSNGSALASTRPAVAQAAVQTTMPSEEDQTVVQVDKELALQQRTVEVPEPKRGRAMRLILELWLWLQFSIVIMLFLFTVAKRGPRSILGNAASRTVKRIE